MPNNNETTTRFKVDISELKREFQDAQRHIRVVTSEFKAATAGMDNWQDSTDGVSAKLKQLNGVLEAEETKLESLTRQYELAAAEQGENSKGAQELLIRLNNQRASVERVRTSIENYTNRLSDLVAESNRAESETEKLRKTISKQESDLSSLKAEYGNLVAAQQGSSDEAKELARQIGVLSADLRNNRSALNDAERAADEFDQSLEDTADSAKDAGDGFTVMKGALADLLAEGIQAVVGGLKDFVLETESAYNKFQAATGASAEEMKAFKSEINGLYTSGVGETLTDIGDKMAYVKHVTGEVDPSKIRELTENAIALEDTFGSDFNETIRGVNNLMTHFGIDAEEAFNLFAKGSQEGLDYTSELGDNIAEYGGNFQQAGYTAEEYFQLLKNGTKSGAYNLDKVNDSINEIKNRLGDGSIKESIEIFSKDTQKAFKAWENGEATMKDVIDSIVDDINECEDEQEALTMAATAFGTMGEDANLKVVKSLKSTGDEFENVKDTMKDIKDIRYDDVGKRFKSLGRTLQNELLAPLAEKALPYFEKLADVAIENIDKIIPVITGIGGALATVFVVNKIATFVTSLKTLATGLGLVKLATDAQTASTVALNTAWYASPVTWFIGAIAALAGGLAYLTIKSGEAAAKEYKLSEAQEATIESAKALNDEYEQMNEARNKATDGITAEYGYLSELKDELNGLVDANGKVKEGYEDRANFIVTQLSEALGLEKKKIWELIEANGELGESIDEILRKKQAEATLTANESAYTEAIEKRNEALSTYQDNLKVLEEAEKKYNESQKKYNEVMENYNATLKANPEAASYYIQGQYSVLKANDEAKESYEKAKKGVEDSEEAYVGYLTTIQNYEGLSSAIISGEADKITVALQNIQTGFQTAEIGTKQSLENQVKNMQENYDSLRQAIADGMPGVTQAQVDAAKEMVDKATEELDKFETNAAKASTKAGNAATTTFLGFGNTFELTGRDGATRLVNGFDLLYPEFTEAGTNAANSMASGASANFPILEKTGKESAAAFERGLGSGAPYAVGVEVAETANDGIESVDAYTSGDNFTAGFKNGMSSGESAISIWDAAWNLGQKALSALRKSIKEGSPSKETKKSGNWFVLGFSNAISDGTKKVVESTRSMAVEALDTLNSEMESGINAPTINGIKSSMASTRKAVGSGSQTLSSPVVNNYNNFYQTNNSPKALSRLEIYRQSKNLLGYAGGV